MQFHLDNYPLQEYEPSLLYKLCILVGVIDIALFFSCIFAANVNRFFDKYDNNEEEVEIIHQVDYTDKYPIEDAAHENDTINPNSYIMDYTPDGIIILKYDEEEEGFVYWCNKKTIPYKYLETAARKYVSIYCCKNKYINRKKELEEKKRVIEERKKEAEERRNMEEEDKKEDSKEESVFATFKPYNKTNKSEPNTHNSNVVVCDRSNKYIRRGNVNEFELLQTDQHSVTETMPKLDFETFKKLFMQHNQDSNTASQDNETENNSFDVELNDALLDITIKKDV